jgi:sugar lactone lactonase YvrE
MAGDAVTANGLAFAPDARALYWADTAAHAVRAWDWASETNTLSNPRAFHQFDAKPAGWLPGIPYQGRPDGATIDAEGGYWAAMFEGAQLLRLAPSGELLEALPLPVQCPTMPCFGGDDLRTLFVTSARRGRPADELARLPASGQVVHARVAVAGRPVAFFDD